MKRTLWLLVLAGLMVAGSSCHKNEKKARPVKTEKVAKEKKAKRVKKQKHEKVERHTEAATM